MSGIVSILPKGEGFSPQQFGAISLCVRDFTEFSRYRNTTTVVGGIASPGFTGLRYLTPPPARWYENRTRTYARGAAAIINREKAGLAEIHNRPLLLRLISTQTNCRLALHLHNDPQEMEETRTPKERLQLLARCDAVYCVSGYIRNRFLEGLPEPTAEKLHVIHNGIALPATLPSKENHIVFAGRMTEGKGALLLAEALRIALPLLPSWRALFIGSRRHEAGRALTPHERHIADMLAPLEGQIEITGFLSHPETLAHFARAHIAVVPSVWEEPFGRTALEAMAYGCAVISSGRGGLHEVTGDAALTLPDLTPALLANAISKLATEAQERTALQTLAQERAQKFSIAGCAAALDTVRESLLTAPYTKDRKRYA